MNKKKLFWAVGLMAPFYFGFGSPSFGDTSSIPYSLKPDWQSKVQGQCGTGLVFADITGDGWKDMVISNGNDIAKQHLVVYYNNGDGTFPRMPNWESKDYEYNGNLSIGDINNDGLLDVAVSIYLGQDHTYDGGGIKVYLNKGKANSYLEKTPSWRQTGYPSFNNDLGDADGDGDLDLAVAGGNPIAEEETFAHQSACQYPPTNILKPLVLKEIVSSTETKPPKTPHVSYQRIYYNNNGVLEKKASWKSSKKYSAMDVKFADLNKDGLADVIFAGSKPVAYFGTKNGKINVRPDWSSTQRNHFSNQIDYAASLNVKNSEPLNSKARVSSLMVASNNYMGGGFGGLDLFRFTSPYIYMYNPKTSSPTWSVQTGSWGSGVTLADVNSDGFLDLIGLLWAPANSSVLGAPIQIYLGNGLDFEKSPAYTSNTSSVTEIAAVADLDKKGLVELFDTFPKKSIAGYRVLTLSQQNIEDITAVIVNGKALDPQQYATIPGKNLVYLENPLSEYDEVRVKYSISHSLDLGVTNWDCDKGDFIFYNKNTQ